MAHFAQIGRNDKVLKVVKIENADMLDSNGVEQESIGQNFLAENHGSFPERVQCTINTFENVHALGGVPLRANFPGVGWYYDETNDRLNITDYGADEETTHVTIDNTNSRVGIGSIEPSKLLDLSAT